MTRVRRRRARPEIDTGPTPEQRVEWHRSQMATRAKGEYEFAGRPDLAMALSLAQRDGNDAEVDRLSDPRAWAWWREGAPLPAVHQPD